VAFDRGEHSAPSVLAQKLRKEHWSKYKVERGSEVERARIADMDMNRQTEPLRSPAKLGGQLGIDVQSSDAASSACQRETHPSRPAADLEYVTGRSGMFARRPGEPAPERDVSLVRTALEVVPDRLETGRR
jgi:hypothetical protein